MTSTQSPPVAASPRGGRTFGRAVIAGIAVLAVAAYSFDASDTPPAAAPDTVSPSPSNTATVTVGPGRTTVVVDGNFPDIPVEFTLPAGWEPTDGWVAKTDNYGCPEGSGGPPFSFVFMDVANIYADGCQWRLVDPKPGRTVDDLAAAYAKVPGYRGAEKTTVDGFAGQLVEYAVPAYDPDDCEEGVFALFNEEGHPASEPNVLASTPSSTTRSGSSMCAAPG